MKVIPFEKLYNTEFVITETLAKSQFWYPKGNVYNALGTQIAPNLVTVVIFDFRAYDTLGESIILLTAGLVVLLIFGRGLLGDKQWIRVV